jgi:alkylation response protein AidB-like acyl-CoA dehydrogenase
MFDFQFTEEQKMLREMVRDFADNEVRPIAKQIDENEKIPDELIKKLGELGLLGAAFPVEYGGGGFGEVGYCIIQEEISHACLSTSTFIGAHQSIGTNAIFIGGSEQLKQKYVVPMAQGKLIGAFCLTEVQAGSDSFNLRTTAKPDGDAWILNGDKMWITNGGLADVVSVFARTPKGISAFVVETKWPGFTAAPAEKKMGIRGSTTNAITFDNVRIPKENMIGHEGRGFLIAMKTLDAGRLGLGAACLGAAKEMIALSTKYAKERQQFDQAIANFQGIQFMLSEMATLTYAMENMIYRTAFDYDMKRNISTHSAMVKLFCSEAIDTIVDYAVQIHGGMGYSREYPIERFYRDSRINRIFEGTNEIQKGIIARDVLKHNGFL